MISGNVTHHNVSDYGYIDAELVEEPTSVSSSQSVGEGPQAEASQSAVSSQSTSPR